MWKVSAGFSTVGVNAVKFSTTHCTGTLVGGTAVTAFGFGFAVAPLATPLKPVIEFGPALPMTFVTAPAAGKVSVRFALELATCGSALFRSRVIPPPWSPEKSSVSPVIPAGSLSRDFTDLQTVARGAPTK